MPLARIEREMSVWAEVEGRRDIIANGDFLLVSWASSDGEVGGGQNHCSLSIPLGSRAALPMLPTLLFEMFRGSARNVLEIDLPLVQFWWPFRAC